MKKVLGPGSLYTFLWYCNRAGMEREILDCGAGGSNPPLSIFYEHGYKTFGIEISNDQLLKAQEFCRENAMDLNIMKGDMRKLHFNDEFISFIYTYNSIFHLTKNDTLKAIGEIERVLRKGGLCFINFLSVDDCGFGEGLEVGKGEFEQSEYGENVIHSYYKDDEPDIYFENMTIIRKEKKVIKQNIDGNNYTLAYIEYILKKN